MNVKINEKTAEWFEKKAGDLGLDIDDLVDFVLNAYIKKTDPEKASEITGRRRASIGLTHEEGKSYVNITVEKSIWKRSQQAAKKTKQDPVEMVSEILTDFLTAMDV